MKCDVMYKEETAYEMLISDWSSDVCSADLGIPAIQERRYYKFNGMHDERYDEGICVYNAAGECIANYPKQHSANLKTRHQAANQWLKPMVRIWKNLRTKLVEDGKIEAGAAPSYYIEGLLYNVPDEKFGSRSDASFVTSRWEERRVGNECVRRSQAR